MPNVSSWVSFENFLAFKFPPILYSHRNAFLVREHYTLWVVIRIGEFEVHVFFVSLNYTFIGVEIFISLPLYVYFSILSINGSIVTLAYFVHWNLIRSRPCLCKVWVLLKYPLWLRLSNLEFYSKTSLNFFFSLFGFTYLLYVNSIV